MATSTEALFTRDFCVTFRRCPSTLLFDEDGAILSAGREKKRIAFRGLEEFPFTFVSYKNLSDCYYHNRLYRKFIERKFLPLQIIINGETKIVFVNINSLSKRLQIPKEKILSSDFEKELKKALAPTTLKALTFLLPFFHNQISRASEYHRFIEEYKNQNPRFQGKVRGEKPFLIDQDHTSYLIAHKSEKSATKSERRPEKKKIYTALDYDHQRVVVIVVCKISLSRETKYLTQLNHLNICKHFGYGSYPAKTIDLRQSSTRFYIILEAGQSEDLRDVLISQNITLEERKRFTQEILSTGIYLRDNRVIHRDIKPENYIIVTNETGNRSLRLIDFAVSCDMDSDGEEKKIPAGTFDLISPEYANILLKLKSLEGQKASLTKKYYFLEGKYCDLLKQLCERSDDEEINQKCTQLDLQIQNTRELINEKIHEIRNYKNELALVTTHQFDMWAIAITIFEINTLFLDQKFIKDVWRAVDKINRGKRYFIEMPSDENSLERLIFEMLQNDPKLRPSLDEVLARYTWLSERL